MNTLTKSLIGLGVAAALAGCSGLPDRVDNLEQARAAVRKAEQDPLASQVASREIASAHDALNDADNAYRNRESLQLIEHDAYLAQRYADIAEQRIAEQRAKNQIADTKADQDRVLLESRTREAQAAEQRSDQARQQNQQIREQNEQIQQQTEALQQQKDTVAQQAESAEQRNQELQKQLDDLKAKQTDQGTVLTLGDVLFDSSQSTLNSGADATLDKLAQFMRANMDRQVMVQGYTDSRGSDQYNQQLSERRADAVRNALVMRGIDPQRVRTVGLGKSYPVASNDTSAGMQRNRRVEIVISDENGQFPPAAEERTADAQSQGAASG